MGMVRPSIDPEFSGHLFSQRSFGKHSANGLIHHFGWFLRHEEFSRDGFEPSWVARVVMVGLGFHFLSG